MMGWRSLKCRIHDDAAAEADVCLRCVMCFSFLTIIFFFIQHKKLIPKLKYYHVLNFCCPSNILNIRNIKKKKKNERKIVGNMMKMKTKLHASCYGLISCYLLASEA